MNIYCFNNSKDPLLLVIKGHFPDTTHNYLFLWLNDNGGVWSSYRISAPSMHPGIKQLV